MSQLVAHTLNVMIANTVTMVLVDALSSVNGASVMGGWDAWVAVLGND
ncbi:hypothetical protein BIFGAL_03081 [Bifidobacterium gallicum DSM 20093 = LMG 11596]|uniref:Uncharacterized protein n=1 Tax=Bifidobacterium gallicum DSM 20093 = LMG 11596 TaxID=561180 RepID=D1NTC4_9BIFI|nr:hypothetical protein BIFGAL_03081 [Bifidobacterium gallicum DSM 20093 = LMG 11596]